MTQPAVELKHRQSFKDYFSLVAEGYAKNRPGYPPKLFEYLSSIAAHHRRAWDCATGNGQAAIGLSDFFEAVLASDASEKQIRHARPNQKIQYFVSPAEKTPLTSHSIDMITVAQALHWFDFEMFFREVHRVLKPTGVIAVWCYGWMHIVPEVDRVLEYFKTNVVGPYWTPERRYVDEEYRTIPFLVIEHTAPSFSIEREWSVDDVLGYLNTWSSSRLFKERNNKGPSELIREELKKVWGNPEEHRLVTWPLFVRVGKV